MNISGMMYHGVNNHPSNPIVGDFFYNTATASSFVWDGNSWIEIVATEYAETCSINELRVEQEKKANLEKFLKYKNVAIDEEEFNDYCDSLKVMDELIKE